MDPTFGLLASEWRDFRARVREIPVVPDGTPAELRAWLADRFDFGAPRPLPEVTRDVAGALRRWTLHTTHPRYFGLFNPDVHEASVMADALAAIFNPQVAGWTHAPIANEMERHSLEWFMGTIGYDPATSYGSYTSGGSEANHTAVLAALMRRWPGFGADGVRALPPRLALYVSTESHHSFVKIARLTGLGTSAVRQVPATARLEMDVPALVARLDEDARAGIVPLMVVATAGTTGGGAIDPIAAIADVCEARGIWLHADAAWGGSALLLPELRDRFRGIERADSVTWDAHKWLSVSMGAGMVFTRHPDATRAAFDVHTTYVPAAHSGTVDPYQTTMQWSRRFIGLKVLMTLASLGAEGMRAALRHQVAMGDRLRERLRLAGWRVVNDTPLPLVCATHDALAGREGAVADLVSRALARRRVWFSEVVLGGGRVHAARFCITSYRTDEEDLAVLVEELEAARHEANGDR